MSFVIAPRNVTLFKVKISNIRCELKNAVKDAKTMYVDGNFDMFRTFSTPKEKGSLQFPEWPKFELMFIYQTEYVEMLIAKRFRLSLNYVISDGSEGSSGLIAEGCCGGKSSTDFIGEAEVDLMTIATGPDALVLTLKNGDMETGRIFAKVEMEEISEMQAELRNFVFTASDPKKFEESPIIVVGKKGHVDPLLVKSRAYKGPALVHTQQMPPFSSAGDAGAPPCKFELPTSVTHYFSTSLPDLSETAGLVIDICKSGLCGSEVLGTVDLDFYKFLWMIEENRDPEGLRRKSLNAEHEMDDAAAVLGAAEEELAAAERRAASGLVGANEVGSLAAAVDEAERRYAALKEAYEALATRAAVVVEREPGYGWFRFIKRETNEEGHFTGGRSAVSVRDPSTGAVVGTIEGECHLTYMPRYSQMRGGATVDGVVCDGIMYQFATIEPPFKSKVHRLQMDDADYA